MHNQEHRLHLVRFVSVPSLVLALQYLAYGQATTQPATPTRDPQAATLVGQAITALTGGKAASGATLNGQATRTAGSDVETGTAVLQAKGHLESKIALTLSGGSWQEIWSDSQGSWTGPDGQSHSQAFHNSLVIGNWFCPAVALQALAADTSFGLAYVAAETRQGVQVQHIQSTRILPGAGTAPDPVIQQLTAIELYLDATTFLPVALEFNTHPDFDALRNLPVRVELGNYQSVNGIGAPFHIQKFLQGSLFLDISVSTAAFNSGLSDAVFAIP